MSINRGVYKWVKVIILMVEYYKAYEKEFTIYFLI